MIMPYPDREEFTETIHKLIAREKYLMVQNADLLAALEKIEAFDYSVTLLTIQEIARAAIASVKGESNHEI